ncbi:ABC transporter permease [Oceanivirga miroungae]|uniref:ABC3 transporter permease C-terminal domain-containing protein n=1 Tax=Oceanivirga miroungae TaxID=1130046 RepID=A0A6I8M768_9FUSO|nr:FtsX-like permease family protein [Oceanivirga miroungae]VWL85256.1 hypothetical protein OMES3154_00539 [Oceanivirga miroungae]
MIEIFIAIRHLVKRRFQTIISVIAISLALIIFITSLAVSDGLTKNTLNSILSLNPHLTVKFFKQNEGDYEKLLNDLDSDIIIDKKATIDIKGFIKYNGIDIIPIIKATNLENKKLEIVEGKLDNSKNYIIMGEKLRSSIGANIGDKISVLDIKGKEIRLKLGATFKTGFLPYDSNLVIIPLKVGMILNEEGNTVSSLDISVKNPSDVKVLNELKMDIFNKYENTYSYTWAEENANLLQAIKLEKFILIVILSFLVLIASFVVAIILNISVREKTNDIGILKAFGYTKKSILKIFVFEGLVVGILGIIVSIILSPIVIALLRIIAKNILESTYYIKGLPIEINIHEIIIIYVVSLVIIFVASIMPAIKAAKLDTAQAIRFNL